LVVDLPFEVIADKAGMKNIEVVEETPEIKETPEETSAE
jgi:hypothetical protein